MWKGPRSSHANAGNLSASGAGAGTELPRLNLAVPASRGGTLWFRNCRSDGTLGQRSLPAGKPVKKGKKWLMTQLFRAEPAQYLAI